LGLPARHRLIIARRSAPDAYQKDAIQAPFGGGLIWEPLEGKRACRIKSEMAGNIFDRDQWPAMIDFMIGAMVRMENAFKEPLAAINRKLRTGERIALAPALAPADAPVEAAEGTRLSASLIHG
jgi:hypothetical protein